MSGEENMDESRALAPLDELDARLAGTTNVAQVRVMDDLIGVMLQKYMKSSEEKKAAWIAKLKTARRGGELLIDMAEQGERQGLGRPKKVPERDLLANLGLSKNRSSRWQAVANKPQTEFDALIAEIMGADEDGDLAVTVMGGLKGSTSNEWYTPSRYIEAAREVMGGIDLDPASSELANQTVKATEWYGWETKPPSLERDWIGCVWLNPPYGKGSGEFTINLVSEYDAGRVTAAVLLLNAYGFDNEWFRPLWDYPICFTDHRIVFTSPSRVSGGPANGNIFVYLGPDWRKFAAVFHEFGHVVRDVELP